MRIYLLQIQSLIQYVYSALKEQLQSDRKPGFHHVLHAFRFHDCLPGSLQLGAILTNQAAWLSSVPCVLEDIAAAPEAKLIGLQNSVARRSMLYSSTYPC